MWHLPFLLYSNFCRPSVLIFLSLSRKFRFPYMMFRWAFYLVKWDFLPRRDRQFNSPPRSAAVTSIPPSFPPFCLVYLWLSCLFFYLSVRISELCLLFLLCGLGFFVPTTTRSTSLNRLLLSLNSHRSSIFSFAIHVYVTM